jgi:DNA repair protein RecO (recombination protein O)
MASGTYKATGINLKSIPLGESDRLLTILTEEYGLLRAVAPGSRKHKSSLGGRSSLFVVNQLLLAKGRNLDKVIQAESLESYPGLSQDLSKLTASQYLAELALYQALSEQSQAELFQLLRHLLGQLEKAPKAMVLPHLTHATFHLLAVAGLAPQVQSCCVTQQPIEPNFTDLDWRVGFSSTAGGVVDLAESHAADLSARLTATELELLQYLPEPDFVQSLAQNAVQGSASANIQSWLSVERVLRHYAQYHFDQPIRSSALIDLCFVSVRPLSELTP